LGAGHRESNLIPRAQQGDKTAQVIHGLLRKLIVYQFHNTSPTARLRSKWDKEDNGWLKEDAGNIAPFLLRLRESEPRYYQRILESIRLILPFFAEFELEPENGRLLLKWRERGSDLVFAASQAADGMLRVICLVTLLLQPAADLPDVLILDEPELGLHPYAITVIAGLIRSVSTQTQVIVATQSMPLIDCFEPADIVVVERSNRESQFRRLDAKALEEWLKDYSLSELWEKNVIGGRPS
jgi:predicted ATPase